jgi:hypothetical protein
MATAVELLTEAYKLGLNQSVIAKLLKISAGQFSDQVNGVKQFTPDLERQFVSLLQQLTELRQAKIAVDWSSVEDIRVALKLREDAKGLIEQTMADMRVSEIR